MEKVYKATEKGKLVLSHLAGADRPLTGAEIAELTGLNPKGIHGVLNGLVKGGAVSKEDKVTLPVINKDGEEEEREYVTYAITPFGAEIDLE